MFLKSLTLKGFKSFASSTTLDLEPGVTVVVGPNGSGKSNVVDAIGWVLGAQAPSTVRSQKMDDVIFAGTARRSALGRAEVSLTIDNAAGLLPVELSEVTLTRTLFRNGESEYAVNGVPCRLLDVQELLSDSGVGRQQHVIVSQGQIDAVLNARPEDRRLIIEEAAGVLKFRRRKEKAERRLAGTEGNLTRLGDLLREVRRQVRPLERQADAARRHGAVVAELTAIRTHLAGQALAGLRAQLDRGARDGQELTARDRALRADLARLDTDVLAAEARLSAMGGDDLRDALVRFEALRGRARGLAAVLAERRRGIDRDRGAAVDRAVIASLEAEAARLDTELTAVEAEAARIAPDIDDVSEVERRLDEARARLRVDEEGQRGAAPGRRAADVRGQLAAVRAGLQRDAGEVARARTRLAAAEDKAERLRAEEARLAAEAVDAEVARRDSVARATAADHGCAAAAADLVAAEACLRTADDERHRWAARAEALGIALDEARARAGAERLAGVDGVVGALIDLVEVDPGWEAAFEAAAADALAAVVVADAGAARGALDALRDGDGSGAVLALGAGADPAPVPVSGASPLRPRVHSSRPDVAALLERLLGATVVVDGWTEAIDLALAHPAAVVVTRDGDRFGPTGWRVGATGAGVTAAALAEARHRAERAAAVAIDAATDAAAARDALERARAAAAELLRSVDRVDARQRGAAHGLARIAVELREGAAEIAALQSHVGDLTDRMAADRARLAELEAVLPAIEAEEAGAAEQARAVATARDQLDEQVAAVGARRSQLDVWAAGIDERRQLLRRRRQEIEHRLAADVAERREAEVRRVELALRATATERLHRLVEARLAAVEAEVGALRDRRQRQSEAIRAVVAHLERFRAERAQAERSLTELGGRLQRAGIQEAETRLRIETAVEGLRRDLDVEPDVAMAAPLPPLPDGVTAPARVRELERDLRLMGPINPLALEELAALQERHEFLQGQLDDVKATRRDLTRVIRVVDGEIVNVFAAAYADVATNFALLFETLFPGGRGSLRLTDPEDLLGTGIELEAKPSGKNVKKLSLLSGGERSLTALAYLFAVFRARPSPFYVMDEVEAALDDVNLHRFLDLVGEFRADAQLVIVSHQKRTMEAADCLYGVTMEPGGTSQVLSERLSATA